MTFLLDTNVCIYALKGTYPSIAGHLARLRPEEVQIPSMVKAELLVGAQKSVQRNHTLRVVEAFLQPYSIAPFDGEAAKAYATIRAELERKGTPIGPNDLIIAATVIAQGGTLITHNQREFQRVEGLKVEDWTR